ncbi:MAG: hypothetical protein KGJ03_00425 [Betaproteobacteria bacterium]|nr:hypothetical protein [Betaproteobacteria bacterium]MBU6511931.1 hypothetical protein [Betaproteobacteria bacterium]MDE1954161.1 hypothetical protein [Betaproteobacteria bacterium]MDE2152292.1 hypothetical protein [Betaproteobacteria bacterium]MDE2479183.1 hypothetical protein [Betaproteobacteria bacterium]
MHFPHSDPSRPLREDDAAGSGKRPSRPAHNPQAREEHLQYERELLRRNRDVEAQLDHALVESFPASDPLAVTPEGVFPASDPRLADDDTPENGGPGSPPRDGRQGR